ncbi:MAG: hypothetical protein GY708_29425 [Actinomycetia bacterium]|nr:hypothetical protein [Actinomycetes bacterium]MCP4960523.1 hypothetical protein [Actinomycetes bacterium]
MNTRLRKGLGMAGTVAISLLALAGCSSFDREGSIEQSMDDFGMTRAQAECFVDDMVDEFGEDRVTSDDTPTDEEAEKIFEILATCSA